MKELKKMNLAELRKLSRTEMKAIMAGSGTYGNGCKTIWQTCGGPGTSFCCDGLYCNNGYCNTK